MRRSRRRVGRAWVAHALARTLALLVASIATLLAPGAAAQSPADAAGPISTPAPEPAPACPPTLQPPTPEQVQAAQRAAHDRGLLWKISRDGASSYLYGSVHVGKLEWAIPGPRLGAALNASDTIALELDPTDPSLAARLDAPAAAAPALPPALEERLARRLDAACLSAPLREHLQRQHPMLRAVTLALMEVRWEGLDAAYGQEILLATFGRATQRRIVSLETPESQLATILPRSARELQAGLASLLDQLDDGSVRRSVVQLGAAWERGDLALFEDYERWCECVRDEVDRALMRRLLDDRNGPMAERIDALHRSGNGRLLAAVGTLHMVGPQGLPALLRARGFTVERLVSPP
jgi:uncharacterized protein YbaP (TraB family)